MFMKHSLNEYMKLEYWVKICCVIWSYTKYHWNTNREREGSGISKLQRHTFDEYFYLINCYENCFPKIECRFSRMFFVDIIIFPFIPYHQLSTWPPPPPAVLHRVSDEAIGLHVRRLLVQQDADHRLRGTLPGTGGGTYAQTHKWQVHVTLTPCFRWNFSRRRCLLCTRSRSTPFLLLL